MTVTGDWALTTNGDSSSAILSVRVCPDVTVTVDWALPIHNDFCTAVLVICFARGLIIGSIYGLMARVSPRYDRHG